MQVCLQTGCYSVYVCVHTMWLCFAAVHRLFQMSNWKCAKHSEITNVSWCQWNKIPGCPNWYLKSPVFSNICMRWLLVSATTMSSSMPRQKPCGELNCPFPGPSWPNLLLKVTYTFKQVLFHFSSMNMIQMPLLYNCHCHSIYATNT